MIRRPDLQIESARPATFMVAAFDADWRSREKADYICDGTNDEVEIQAAIDALPANGGLVQLTEGIFNFARSGASQILLSSGTWLRGMGKATQIKLANSIDQTMIGNENATPLSKSGTVDNDITVSDFYVDGNKTNQGGGLDSIWCVGFSTVDNLDIHNLFVENGFTSGIRTEFCNYVKIYNNRVHNSADDCIAINEETKFGTVQNNVCSAAGQGGKTYGAPYGIEVQDGAEDIVVGGNTIVNCSSGGIQISLHAGKPQCVRVAIQENAINNCPSISGIDIVGESGTNHEHITIAGNTIGQLITELDSGGSFTSGTFTDLETISQAVSGATGVILRIDISGDDLLEIEVTSGTFDTTNLVTGGTSSATMTPAAVNSIGIGITISYGAYLSINGNTIEADKYAFLMNNSPVNEIVFSNNVCQGSGSELYGLYLGNTLNRVMIIGNTIRDYNWRGILFEADSVPTGCQIINNNISAVDHSGGAAIVWDMTSAAGADNFLANNYYQATVFYKSKETGSYVLGSLPSNWTDRDEGRINIPLALLREVASDDIDVDTNHGGLLTKDSTPILEYINGDTDSCIRVNWASSNNDPVVFQVPIPPDLDASEDVTLHVRIASGGTTNAVGFDIDSYFEEADTKVSDATTTNQTTVYLEKIATIANADVPAGAQTLTIEMTPVAHTTDIMALTSLWVTYRKK